MNYLIKITLFFALFNQFASADEPSSSTLNGTAFFDNLKKLCGHSFIGDTVFPEDPSHDFADKALIIKVAECSENQIKVPFQVGTDKSRTWVFTLTPSGLELKHDHRHADGTPDKITMYGGLSNKSGSALAQHFPADAYTAKLIPAAATNIWTIELKSNAQELVYSLKRHDKPRYRAEFRQTKINQSAN